MLLDTCESRLSVHISCANLRNMDIIGRSDPFAILYLDPTGIPPSKPLQPDSLSQFPSSSDHHLNLLRSRRRGRYSGRDSRWERVGITETIPNALDVTFATSFEIRYFFERAQKLAVDIFDRDVASENINHLHKHDFLGSADIAVPSLVRAKGQKLTLPLIIPNDPEKKCGTVTLVVEEVSQGKQRLNYDVGLSGIYVNRGKGPYLTVSRPSAAALPNEPWITVMRSKAPGTAAGRGAFNLPKLTYNYEKFCRCDEATPLRFDVTYERGGKHKVVTSVVSSLAEVEAKAGKIELAKKTRCFASANGPTLHLANRLIKEDITFLDYIIGGCEISLVIAIDFTASNGDPSQRGTLHFMDSMEANEYELAIRSVGDILAAYDSDQLFPAYGFGAKLPPEFRQPSHKFPLNNSPDPNCHTIDEVLNMYRHTLYNVRLSGPTVFSEIVRAAADHANEEASCNEQSYSLLLIITDGVINDLDNTLDEITKASSFPLSIVIIGVGDADFTDMDCLDGDDMDLERDIVQFVNFRKYKDTPEVLRSKVLEEIPNQLVQYMLQKGIYPLPPPVD